jgi:predicted RNA binding protein YcfA (HicA-like mRNA interferase family)
MRLAPVSQSELVRRFRRLGWDGPHQRGSHPYMHKDDRVQTIPNPHHHDISVDLLSRILRQAGISRQEWLQTD